MRLLSALLALFSIFGADLAKAVPRSLTPICAIQGSSFTSPYVGETVQSRGVVFADLDQTSQKGFFMQEENCDGNPSTSDGIFVYLGEKIDLVKPGDLVELTGTVQEYYGMTEIQAAPAEVTVISSDNPLPEAEELNPPFPYNDSRWYFETREGMRLRLDQGLVVGPTDEDDRTWLVRADLGIPRVFHDDPQGTGEVICVDDRGLYEITPEARVGDQVQGLVGALDYRMGVYCLEPIAAPIHIPLTAVHVSTSEQSPSNMDSFAFSVASFNLLDLFDTIDDPAVEDVDLSGTEYQRRLQKRALAIHDALSEPAFIAVQEAENITVTLDLAARPEIQADYAALLVDGPDQRGLDVGLLYRLDQAQIISSQVWQGCTRLVDGLGPDGNRDTYNPQNAITCDTNHDGVLDGNRLFSRPPLLIQAWVCPSGCPGTPQKESPSQDPFQIWLVVNHWKSKVEDWSTVQYTLPRRMEQANFVAGLVQEILTFDPAASLIVLGDLNDHPDSQPLSVLTSPGWLDLSTRIERSARYSYIHQGVSQVLDYLLVRLHPPLAAGAVRAVHINADFPYMYAGITDSFHRSSDHDILLVEFDLLSHLQYLPLACR